MNAPDSKVDLSLAGGGSAEPGRIGDWTNTWTGLKFYPLDPRPEEIDILDIAKSLGGTCRYLAHCKHYSTAEHSVLVHEMVSRPRKLEALLHDAPEEVLSDLVRPVKRALGKGNDYFALEDLMWKRAIAPKFGLNPTLSDEVIRADAQICVLEKRVLRPRSQSWQLPFEEPRGLRIRCLEPNEASKVFLQTYCRLTGEHYPSLEARFDELLLEDQEAFERHQQEFA